VTRFSARTRYGRVTGAVHGFANLAVKLSRAFGVAAALALVGAALVAVTGQRRTTTIN
jgi:hypothetical protein